MKTRLHKGVKYLILFPGIVISSYIFYYILEFSLSFTIALIAISVAAYMNLILSNKLKVTRNSFALNVYITFALVGSRLFVDPGFNSVFLVKLLIYCTIFIITLPLSGAVVVFCNRSIAKDIEQKIKKKYAWLIFFGITFVCYSVFILAFNPAIISYDWYYYIAEAKGILQWEEYHSLFLIFIINSLFKIWDSIYILVLVQMVGIASLLASIFTWFTGKGLNLKLGVILCFIFNIIPSNISLMMTLTKDVYYTIGLLYLTFIFMKFEKDKENILQYIELVLCLSFICLVRPTGYIVSIICFTGLFALKPQKVKILLCLLTGAFIVFGGNTLIKKAVPYAETPPGLKYVGLFQDLLGTYYDNGILTDECRELIEDTIDTKEFKETFSPYWAYYDSYYKALGRIDTKTFLINYIVNFFHNPLTVVKAILCRMDILWNVEKALNGVETWQWITNMPAKDLEYLVPARNVTILTKGFDYLGKMTVQVPLKNIIWRCGIWVIIIIELCINCFRKKKVNDILIFLPMLSQIATYIVSLGWMHYRYWWFIQVIGFFIVLYNALIINQKE